MREYAQKVKNPSRFLKEQIDAGLDVESTITMQTADGPKEVVVKDLYARMIKMEKQAEKMTNNNGQLVSEDSGTLSTEELDQDENLGVKRFMVLGQYAHAIIKSVGYGDGKLKNIETSPRFEEIVKQRISDHDISPSTDVPSLIILTIEEDGGVDRYEIEVEIDKKYAKPHVAVINGWLLNADDERGKEMVLPYPQVSERQ